MKPSKSIILAITTLFAIIFLSSCFNRQTLLEGEQLQIQNYINSLGLDFDTLSSGVLLHVDTSYDSVYILYSDEVLLVYTGINLDDNNKVFAKDDSVYVKVNDPYLLDGWKEIFLSVKNKTKGIAIFPFYAAYDKKRIANIIPYSTLVFDFYVEKVIPDTTIKQTKP